MIRANEARFPAFPAASRTIDMPSRYSTFKSPILWQAADDESTLPSIKTGGDAVESIEQDMTNVLSQEIEVLENDDEVRNFQNLKKLVIQNGFQITEKPEESKVILSREVKGRSVKVIWDPTEYQEDDEPESNENEDEEKDEQDEDKEEDEEENPDEPKDNTDIEVKIEIEHEGRKLIANCSIADDGLMYIYTLSAGDESAENVSLDCLSEQAQHRIYDYMDELGVGDGTANFIQMYNRNHKAVTNIQGLRNVLKQFFSVDK